MRILLSIIVGFQFLLGPAYAFTKQENWVWGSGAAALAGCEVNGFVKAGIAGSWLRLLMRSYPDDWKEIEEGYNESIRKQALYSTERGWRRVTLNPTTCGIVTQTVEGIRKARFGPFEALFP